jgi:hypothetical protein
MSTLKKALLVFTAITGFIMFCIHPIEFGNLMFDSYWITLTVLSALTSLMLCFFISIIAVYETI